MSRSSEILKAAAEALENGSDPFHQSFLGEHDVTFDECMDMADFLAIGARLIAWGIENPRQARVAMEGATGSMKMDMITRVLQKMNEQDAARKAGR